MSHLSSVHEAREPCPFYYEDASWVPSLLSSQSLAVVFCVDEVPVMQWEDLGFGNTWTQVLSLALQVLCGYLQVISEPESWETGEDGKCYSPSPAGYYGQRMPKDRKISVRPI